MRTVTLVMLIFAITTSVAVVDLTKASAETVSLQGRIVFPDGEIPIYSNISLGNSSAYVAVRADSSGHYEFHNISPGKYNMTVFAGGKINKAGSFEKDNVEIGPDTQLPITIDVTLSTDPRE